MDINTKTLVRRSAPEGGDGSMAILSNARRLLAEAKTASDFKLVRDAGQAALKFYRSRLECGIECRNDASEIVIRAEAKLGALLAQCPREQGRRKPSTSGTNVQKSIRETVSDLGTNRRQSHRWQEIASLPEPMLEKHIEQTKIDGEELTAASVLRLVRSERKKHTPPKEPDPITTFDVVDAVRKAIWSTYQECPAEMRSLVIPKFRSFLDELEKTGDLSW